MERNNKDTTNGARTLTAANLSGCWEKPETLWLSCPSSGGVLSGKFANNALQHARAFVYNFFDFTAVGRGKGAGAGSGCPRSGVLGGFGGVADAVLAGGLGLVHGGVGAGDELLGRLRVDGEAGDAEGGREL